MAFSCILSACKYCSARDGEVRSTVLDARSIQRHSMAFSCLLSFFSWPSPASYQPKSTAPLYCRYSKVRSTVLDARSIQRHKPFQFLAANLTFCAVCAVECCMRTVPLTVLYCSYSKTERSQVRSFSLFFPRNFQVFFRNDGARYQPVVLKISRSRILQIFLQVAIALQTLDFDSIRLFSLALDIV